MGVQLNIWLPRAVTMECSGLLQWSAHGCCNGVLRGVAMEYSGVLQWSAQGCCNGVLRGVAMHSKSKNLMFTLTVEMATSVASSMRF